MGINPAFNENLRAWELIDTDGCDGNFLYFDRPKDRHTLFLREEPHGN
jgi:hypothetical protein